MNASEPNSRLYRFTGAIDIVMVPAGYYKEVLWIAPKKRVFRVLSEGVHPDSGNCILCEFVGGDVDGLQFLLEPGSNHPDVWPQIADDVK